MVKVQDTYNPVTGEYVKRISDWITLDGSRGWAVNTEQPYVGYGNALSTREVFTSISGGVSGKSTVTKYDTKVFSDLVGQYTEGHTLGGSSLWVSLHNRDTGWSETMLPSNNDVKAYFYGWKMANADGTSPYYRSEVPYTSATWAEWTGVLGSVTKDSSGVTLTAGGSNTYVDKFFVVKANTKYGVIYNVASSNLTGNLMIGNSQSYIDFITGKTVGNNKSVFTTIASPVLNTRFRFWIMPGDASQSIKLKDIRVFELPTGSRIEADFNNLSADELSAKYTFNGLCVKNWKKVIDGTGLTTTLPTATYAGYTPYKMIYQLATPEISYLTPKASIPLYNTNTIVETDTLSDCKADVTVGYKLKNGAAAVGGDTTAPTPDYMSAVNSVSELGDKKGIVQSPNIVVNGNFSNAATGWSSATGYSVENGEFKSIGTGSYSSPYQVVNMVDGHKYYYALSVKNTSTVNCYSDISGVPGSRIDFTGNSNAYIRKSSIFTKTNTGTASIFVTVLTNTGDGLPRYCDNITLIDLTQMYGAGNEPTQVQCDILFATWQDKASTQATLPALRKIGTVADTYNPKTGVLVQRIGKKVFDGTEDWALSATRTNTNLFVNTGGFGAIGTGSDSINFLCSHFIGDWVYSNDRVGAYLNPTGLIRFSIKNTAIQTGTQLKSYLAQQSSNGTPVTLYYQLATPVVINLTPTTMSAYSPITVVSNDSTVKGTVKTDYKLKLNAVSIAGDFIASPECVNEIKDLGNSIDVVSSVGRENILRNSSFRENTNLWSSASQNFVTVDGYDCIKFDGEFGKTKTVTQSLLGKLKVGETYTVSGWWKVENIVRGTTNYTIMFYADGYYNENGVNTWYGLGAKKVSTTIDGWQYVTYQFIPTKEKYGKATSATFFGYTRDYTGSVYMRDFKIEKNSTASLFAPATEDISYNTIVDNTYKTNIALNNPLRSLGTVKDRLFKDSDGKWKVERNIGEKVFDGTESWNKNDGAQTLNTLYYKWSSDFEGGWKQFGLASCSHLPFYDSSVSLINSPNQWLNDSVGFSSGGNASAKYFNFGTIIGIGTNNTNGVKAYLASEHSKGTPVTVQYQLVTPTYETLSQELQTKLDNIPTFANGNYVYTAANDNLQPMLHVDYKKLSWLKSRLLLNSLKIYSRNLTDAELEQNYRIEKERYGM